MPPGRHAELTEIETWLPRVGMAHFATHGFFADATFQSAFQLDRQLFDLDVRSQERVAAAGRNPLVLSGLVLSGANGAIGDGQGIMTAELIAGLPLENLHLVVLSACQTALGDVAGGEGILGLQRAFHLAGARNVVASLWKVDDHLTAELMHLLYLNLIQNGRTPLEALRQSQLQLYRDEEPRPLSLAERGAIKPRRPRELPSGNSRTRPTIEWAAFQLSGPADSCFQPDRK